MRFKELPSRIFVLTIVVMLTIVLWFLDGQFPDMTFFNIDILLKLQVNKYIIERTIGLTT